MAISDGLNNKAAQTTASMNGSGLIADAILARIKNAGLNMNWTISVQEMPDGRISLQINFFPPAS